MASTIAVYGNTALGNSTQNNIAHLEFIANGVNIEELVHLFKQLFSSRRPELPEDVINVELSGPMKRLTLSDMGRGEKDAEEARDYLNTIRNTCFPSLRGFEAVARACLRKYSRTNLAPIIESLSEVHKHKETLNDWLTATQSATLCAYGSINTGQSPWTSELALEILGTAQTAIFRSEFKGLTAIYHFCGQASNKVFSSQEIILQDLILQVIGSRPERFGRKVCQKHDLTETRFINMRSIPNALWTLLWECIEISQIQTLLIVIDNIDVLISNDWHNPQSLDAFRVFMGRLCSPTPEGDVLVKTLITLRRPDIARYIPQRTLKQSSVIMLKVPIPPSWKRMPPNTKAARVYRVPIERGSSKVFDSASSSVSTDDESGSSHSDVKPETRGSNWCDSSSSSSENDSDFGDHDSEGDDTATLEDPTFTSRNSSLSIERNSNNYSSSDKDGKDDSSEDVG